MAKLKVLCVCQAGQCRSFTLAAILNEFYNCEALSIGTTFATDEAMLHECRRADLVVPVEHRQIACEDPNRLAKWTNARCWDREFDGKRRVLDIGPDIWQGPNHPALRDLLRVRASELFR